MDDFRPIEPNPYIVGNPIRDRSMFFGRQEELRFLHDRLETSGREMVVLCGGRRSGKTSILLQVLDGRLGERFVTVLVDMQQLAELRRDGDLWHAVGRRVLDRMAEKGLRTEGLTVPAGDGPDPHAAFRRFLEEATARLENRKLVILVDEYELIEELIHNGTLTTDVTLVMSALLDSTLPVSFLFTGSRRVQERDPVVWSRLMGKAIHRRISFLALGDAERLIREPVRGRMEYGDEAVRGILRLTAGHPFYTQVVCQSLLDRLNERRSTIVEPDDVDGVAEALADSPLPQMVYWWKSLPLLSRVAGSLLAAAADTPQRYVPAAAVEADLEAHRREYGFEARRASVRGALERMVEEEDLEAGDPRDTYRYRMDLIRRWLRVEHPVWEVIRDLGAPGTDLDGIRTLRTGHGRKWLWAALVVVVLAAAAALATLLRPGEPDASAPVKRDGGTAVVAGDGSLGVPPPGADGAVAVLLSDGATDGPPLPEETRYARRFVLMRQVPTPMSEIAETDLGGRTDYFVFFYRGGKLERFEHRNGSGFPQPQGWSDDEWWDLATTFAFEYREDGTVERIIAQRCGTEKAGCVPLAVLIVSPDFRTRRTVVPGHEELPTWNADNISILGYELDARGRPAVTRYLNALGKPQPDALGRLSVQRTRDAEGWTIEERDEILAPAAGEEDERDTAKKSVRIVRTKYDARHNVVETAVFDGENKAIRFPDGTELEGVHRVTATWDQRDRPTLLSYFDTTGQPVPLHRCYAESRAYDARGNTVRQTCLGSDGKPAPNDEDAISVETEYDARGLPQLERSLGRGGLTVQDTLQMEWDDRGNLAAQRWLDETIHGTDGRPVIIKARAFEYDAQGRRTVQRNLDADSRPVAPQGFAVIRFEYNVHGQPVRKRYEGLDGKLTASAGDEYRGVAEILWEYDDYGFRSAQRLRDAAERPVNSPYAAADLRWKVDPMGRVLEERERPARANPPAPDARWPTSVRRTYRYDQDGNPTEERAYGADGKPAPAATGEIVVKRDYDRLGRLTAEWYEDDAEQPMVGGAEQVAKLTRRYAVLGSGDPCWEDAEKKVHCTDAQETPGGESRGTVIETRFFGVDGRPTWSAAHGRGIVRVVSVKDAEERLLEMRYFGDDERPAANRQGMYILRSMWSPSGQVSEEYLGLDGLPVEVEIAPGLRCAHRSWTYDALGHEVEYRTARADGSPCADASGIAARMRRYDGERVVEEQFLDGSGALRAGVGGVARTVWAYDADGRPVRETFQDGAGMPVAPAEWVSDLAATYDEYGRLVRFELAPPLPLGAAGDLLATVEINYQGADALAVPRSPSGNHLIVDGVVALRYPKAEWGGRLGCVGVEGTTMRCAEGTEILLRFLTVQRTVSCGAGSVAPADDRCEWVWAP